MFSYNWKGEKVMLRTVFDIWYLLINFTALLALCILQLSLAAGFVWLVKYIVGGNKDEKNNNVS